MTNMIQTTGKKPSIPDKKNCPRFRGRGCRHCDEDYGRDY